MAEESNATPIQRNAFDVAMELTMLSLRVTKISNESDIHERFLKYYSIVRTVETVNFTELERYLPEEMKEIIQRYK
ncbi:hypothetical protein [Desulfotomaculum sp. 1211_IL3151]|uniref:hypothetical protein n=1 Tax=Desulfotomaculum sp. 1211_IL3151 TaxID=3084055 RepID=UPI002FDA87E1